MVALFSLPKDNVGLGVELLSPGHMLRRIFTLISLQSVVSLLEDLGYINYTNSPEN